MPPASTDECEFLGAELWEYVLYQFQEKLSPARRELWKVLPRHIREGDQKTLQAHQKALRIQRAFDTHLAQQFQVWGWRLLMSRAALGRLAQWEIKDTHLVEMFSANLVRRAKRLQQQTGGRVQVSGEEILRIEKLLLPDLRTLFNKARTDFGKQIRERTNPKLAEFIQKEIEDHPEDYPHAHGNLPDLVGFILRTDNEFAARVRSGRIRPERFLHMLWEVKTGYRWSHLKRLKTSPSRLTE